MTDDASRPKPHPLIRKLHEFLTEQGNLLPLAYHRARTFELVKEPSYEGSDGRTVRRPIWRIYLRVDDMELAAGIVGATPIVDGSFVVEAAAAGVLSDGSLVFRTLGLRTGLYQIRPTPGFLVKSADGLVHSAPTKDGALRVYGRSLGMSEARAHRRHA